MGAISALKHVGTFWFGTWSDDFGKKVVSSAKAAPKGTLLKSSPGIIKESYNYATSVIKSTDKAVINSVENGAVNGAKSGVVKGFFGSMMKKMPLIGGIITAVTEIPKIAKEYKEGGFGAALKQTGRAAVSLSMNAVSCAVAGVAVAAMPLTGGLSATLVPLATYIATGMGAGVVADKINDTVFGKSITDQKEERAKVGGNDAEPTDKNADKQLARAPFSSQEMQNLQQLGNVRQMGFDNPETRALLGLDEQRVNPYQTPFQSPTQLAMNGTQQYSPAEIEQIRMMQLSGQQPQAFSYTG